MKFFLPIRILILVTPFLALCQGPSPNVAHGFQWNWRDSQTPKNTIAEEMDISAEDRAALLDTLTRQFQGDPDPRKRAAETRIKMADLNGDGVYEVIAQAVGDVCSPTGNCPFWVFQKTASGYRLILKRGAIQNFTIQPTRTNGYSDLVLGMHGSATLQGLYLYQFSHGQYRRVGCYDANWTYLDQSGEVHDLKEPRIAPCQ